jgi:hypothetical protein
MRMLCALVFVGLLVGACTGLNKKGSADVPNPVGPINSSGKPDVDKTNGGLDLGSAPNLGGTPDVGNVNAGGTPDPNKSHGKIGNTGAVNSGGRPDASKSIPKKK